MQIAAILLNIGTVMQNSPTSINDIEGAPTNPRMHQKKAEAFVSRILKLFNNGALTLMISPGNKTRFKTMTRLAPVTSADLTKALNLHERYVRGWLATMYVGGIVTIGNDNYLLNGSGGDKIVVGAERISRWETWSWIFARRIWEIEF